MKGAGFIRACACLWVAGMGAGCETPPADGPHEEGPAAETNTYAPLCGDIADDPTSRALFGQAVVSPESVREAIVFGSIDPGYLEPINFEQGFKFDEVDIAATAPADLYVVSIESSEYLTGWRAGEKDYGFNFHLCAREEGGETVPAVTGNLAHITALSPELEALFAAYTFDCYEDVGPEETARKCSVIFDLNEIEPPVIALGTPLGSVGGTGASEYRPGLDFNLVDFRFENQFANPDRLGADDGPGASFRYGTCVYDYFPEPTRSEYLSRIGQNGVYRESEHLPCGTLDIDVAGSASGVWIKEDKAGLDFDTNWVEVLSNLLVLMDHPLRPEDRQVVSTEIRDLAEWFDDGVAVELTRETTGDVNRLFSEMIPGPVYCMRGAAFGQQELSFFYYIGLDDDGQRLRIERLAEDCGQTPLVERSFSSAAMSFVR